MSEFTCASPHLWTQNGVTTLSLDMCFLHGRHFGRPIATIQNVWITLRGELRWIGLNDSDVESALHDGARRTRDHACVRSLSDAQPYRVAQGQPPRRRSATAFIFSTRDLLSCRFVQVDPPGEWARVDAAQGPACRTPTAPNPRQKLRRRSARDDPRERKDTLGGAALGESWALSPGRFL